jgi:hypothetical protein
MLAPIQVHIQLTSIEIFPSCTIHISLRISFQ